MADEITLSVTPLRERTAEEIRVLLARRNMSAAELARRTGLKQPYISRRMTGEVAFDLDDLDSIASALGVPVTDLLPRVTEGRLITTASTRVQPGGTPNVRSGFRAERAGRTGPLSRTHADESMRRPVRTR